MQEIINEFNHDTPINTKDFDKFGRYNFAKRIAKLLIERKSSDSIVISINGIWGEGKTTVLNFIENELRLESNIIYINFNPWRFKSEDQLIISFFNLLAKKIDKEIGTISERIGNEIKKYGCFLAPIGALTGIPISTDALSKFGEELANIDPEEIKKRIEDILKINNKKIVIIMDDIDRLDKNEIQSIFKLVKVSADFKNISYILSFDEEMVASALEEKYSNSSSSRNGSGRNFLEKIIQVPLSLPKINDTILRTFSLECIQQALYITGIKISDNEAQIFFLNYIQGLELMVNTPRIAKRYSNVLQFSLPLVEGEVNLTDFMLLEGIRTFYPSIYNFIYRNPKYFLEGNEKANNDDKQRIENAISFLLSNKKKAILSLLKHLFPRFGTFYGGSSYADDFNNIWNKKKKICSHNHFSRYFSFGVLSDDISDNSLNTIIDDLNSEIISLEHIKNKILKLLNTNNKEKFLFKIGSKIDDLKKHGKKKLLSLLCEEAYKFPESNNPMVIVSQYDRNAMIVSEIIKTYNDFDSELMLLKEVFEISKPSIFGTNIIKWYRTSAEDEGKDIEKINSLYFDVANLVKKKLKNETSPIFFLSDSKSILDELFLLHEYGDKDFLNEYLNSNLINLEAISSFLNLFLTNSFGLETGLISKLSFSSENYLAIKNIFNTDVIFNLIKNLLKEKLNLVEYEKYKLKDLGYTDSEILCNQFCIVHNKNTTNNSTSIDTESQEYDI